MTERGQQRCKEEGTDRQREGKGQGDPIQVDKEPGEEKRTSMEKHLKV